MSQRTQSTLILLAVFAIGLTAGIGAMVWAWPALASHLKKSETHVSLPDMMRKELNLNDDQVAKIQAVVNDADNKRHAIQAEFAPKFQTICDEYTATRQAERNEFDPERQQSEAAFQSILTPQQWQKYNSDHANYQRQHGITPGAIRRPGGPCGNLGRSGGPGRSAGNNNSGGPGGPPPGGGHLYY